MSAVPKATVNALCAAMLPQVLCEVSMQIVISSSSVIPPHAAFITSGVPSSPYVPIISTGIGNIQFFLPKFFFMVLVLS